MRQAGPLWPLSAEPTAAGTFSALAPSSVRQSAARIWKATRSGGEWRNIDNEVNPRHGPTVGRFQGGDVGRRGVRLMPPTTPPPRIAQFRPSMTYRAKG